MSNYDASIRVSTKVDNADLRKLEKEIHSTARNITDSMNGAGASADNVTKRIKQQEGTWDSLSAKAEDYKTRLRALEDKGFGFGDQKYDDLYIAWQNAEYAVKKYRDVLNDRTDQEIDRQAMAIRKVQNGFATAAKSSKKCFQVIQNGAKKSNGLLSTMGTRLKGIALSLLVFNWITKGFNAMIQSMKEGFQNLAHYSDEYNQSMSGLKSELATLKNSLATAFEPLANIIIPYLTQFVSWLNVAADSAAQFMAAVQGKSTYTRAKKQVLDYAKSLDTASKSAQRALASFDQLNVLNKNSTTSAYGETAGAGAFEEVKVNNGVLTYADRIKAIFKNENWEGLGQYMSDGIVVGLKSWADKLDGVDWDGIGTKIGGFLEGVEWTEILAGTGKLVWEGINAGVETWQGSFDKAPIETAIASTIGTLAITKDVNLSLKLGLISFAIGGATEAGNFLGKTFAEILAVALGFDEEKVHEAIWEMEDITITQAITMLFSEEFWTEMQNVKKFIDNWFQETFVDNPNKVYGDLEESTQKKMDALSAIFYVTTLAITKALQSVIDKIGELKASAAKSGIGLGAAVGSAGSSAVISGVKLPKLADGAVIQGGKPFAAILGDQPAGQTNIETPLSTMVDAFKQAMSECGGTGGSFTFVAQLDGRTIFKETVRQEQMQYNATGKGAFQH